MRRVNTADTQRGAKLNPSTRALSCGTPFRCGPGALSRPARRYQMLPAEVSALCIAGRDEGECS